MKTAEFQEGVVTGITRLLKAGKVGAARLAEIAKGTLEISGRHPRVVSAKALGGFVAAFPECANFLKKNLEEAEAGERKENVNVIRSKIAQSSS